MDTSPKPPANYAYNFYEYPHDEPVNCLCEEALVYAAVEAVLLVLLAHSWSADLITLTAFIDLCEFNVVLLHVLVPSSTIVRFVRLLLIG